MTDAIAPPAQDARWDDPIPKTSPPVGGYDDAQLHREAMSILGLSASAADAVLNDYDPGQLRTLLDRRLSGDRQ